MVDGRRRRELKETFDLGLGFIGFFTVAFVAITVWTELSGKDAVWSAITTLFIGAVFAAIWIGRKHYLERTAKEHERTDR